MNFSFSPLCCSYLNIDKTKKNSKKNKEKKFTSSLYNGINISLYLLLLCYCVCLLQLYHIGGSCSFCNPLVISWLFHPPASKRSHLKLEIINSHLWACNLAFCVVKCHPVFILVLFKSVIFVWCYVLDLYNSLSSAASINALLFSVPRSLMQMWNKRLILLELHFLPFTLRTSPLRK